MSDRDTPDESGLSTDVGVHLDRLRIGSIPGEGSEVDISGNPGDGTGWGAWPQGQGTSESREEGRDTTPDTDQASSEKRIGAEHGQLADSGVTTGPVGT
jgi:hypothetical protein